MRTFVIFYALGVFVLQQQTELPEIAFVGRSNAGKSTAINTLTQQKRLAFASKTPNAIANP